MLMMFLASFLVAQVEPWESIESKIDWQAKDMAWQELAKDQKLSDFVQPATEHYFVFERSWKFPKRESFPWVGVGYKNEVEIEKSLIEPIVDLQKMSALLDTHTVFCVLHFSDLIDIFVPPYIIASQAIPLKSILETSLENGILQTELKLSENMMIDRVVCFSNETIMVERLEAAVPDSWKLKRRAEKKPEETPYSELPQEKDVTEVSFEKAKEESKFYQFTGMGDSLNFSSGDSFDLRKYLDGPGSAEVRRGFTRYGAGTFEEYYQRLGPNSSLRIRIEQYPDYWRYPRDRYYLDRR